MTVWNIWKLTLPTGSAGHPTEIYYPALASYTLSPWFVRKSDRTTFRANCGGTTTSGSKYPRSELREMNGNRLASWSTTVGDHTMFVTFAPVHVPYHKPDVVVAQVHDGSDDVVQVRFEGHGDGSLYGTLFVEHDGDMVGAPLDANFKLGTQKRVKIHVKDGVIRVKYGFWTKRKFSVSTSGCYFKTGCYTQSNTYYDRGTDYAEVDIFDVQVIHA